MVGLVEYRNTFLDDFYIEKVNSLYTKLLYDVLSVPFIGNLNMFCLSIVMKCLTLSFNFSYMLILSPEDIGDQRSNTILIFLLNLDL